MATVELSFTALPAHVRTARLVAAAVARRSGVDEAVLDEVRLAVGEACSRAVYLHRRYCPDRPVLVTLTDDAEAFRVVVSDEAPNHDGSAGPDGTSLDELAESSDLDLDTLSPGVGLAVITGLVDDLSVQPAGRPDGNGLVIRMSWPTSD